MLPVPVPFMELLEFLDKYSALLAALGGGVGVKFIDKVLSRRSEQFQEATQIRGELWTEVAQLRATVDEWRQEADTWRAKYWEQVQENVTVRAELEQLRVEFDALKQRLDSPGNAPEK